MEVCGRMSKYDHDEYYESNRVNVHYRISSLLFRTLRWIEVWEILEPVRNLSEARREIHWEDQHFSQMCQKISKKLPFKKRLKHSKQTFFVSKVSQKQNGRRKSLLDCFFFVVVVRSAMLYNVLGSAWRRLSCSDYGFYCVIQAEAVRRATLCFLHQFVWGNYWGSLVSMETRFETCPGYRFWFSSY